MRSWIFGGKKGDESSGDASASAAASDGRSTGTFRSAPANSRPVNPGRSLFTNTARALETERKVSLAARSLGDGVQKCVHAAKTQQEDQWRAQLLEFLRMKDMDVLLENTDAPKFVLRCVENELPPNLIHCLRLLRVYELKNATRQERQDDEQHVPEATFKVAKLLKSLCVDGTSVGEQLRPHLFGLLALTGASYPKGGVHVASAASTVILAFSQHCLTKPLVWFLHDRKMIVHMTEDVKELCGLPQQQNQQQQNPQQPNCLYGKPAAEEGLWTVAMTTLVHLVVHSCKTQCFELLFDFEKANGYHTLKYAILESPPDEAQKMIKLLPMLASCHTAKDQPPGLMTNNKVVDEVILKLWKQALPFFDQPVNDDTLPDLAQQSLIRDAFVVLQAGVDTTTEQHDSSVQRLNSDMALGLLEAMLQLYSDHEQNYQILEDKHNILSLYLLGFCIFRDDSLKQLILKTLEYVVIGVGGKAAVQPLTVTSHVFFAMSQALLKGQADDDIKRDLETVCGCLEKLLQFDNRVAPILIESGIMTGRLESLLELLCDEDGDGEQPPESTHKDLVFVAVCRVLKLLVSHQLKGEEQSSVNLYKWMFTAIQSLGSEAAEHAASVFESHMSSHVSSNLMTKDITFCFEMMDYFIDMTGTLRCLPGFQQDDDEAATAGPVSATTIQREVALLSMLKGVLDSSSIAREAFRNCGGYTVIVRSLLCLEGTALQETGGADCAKVLLVWLQAALGLVAATTGSSKSRSAIDAALSSGYTVDLMVDPITAQLAAPSPASRNRIHLRRSSFYLNLATAISRTGILHTDACGQVMDLILGHVDVSLKLSALEESVEQQEPAEDENNNAKSKQDSKSSGNQSLHTVHNADGVRLLLGVSVFLPDENRFLAVQALNLILALCSTDKLGKTLSQVATCGLCWSLTNPKEFAPVLVNGSHPLYSHYVQLLRRIASYSMSYTDFVSMLRCVAGPLLRVDGVDVRVRLPVISSSVRSKSTLSLSRQSSEMARDTMRDLDKEFCERLETLRIISHRSDPVPRCKLGGDSINTIAVLMHKVKVEERLYATAESGRLKFFEVESIDSSAINSEENASAGSPAPGGSERIWTPLASSGFSYSMWMRHSESDSSGKTSGNFYVLDISSPSASSSTNTTNPVFLSIWYDVQSQRFNVLSSASHRSEPTCFPVSPLNPHVWHHVMVTYTPPKRSMMARKAVFELYVDGRPLEADVRVESVNLPPNSRLIIGAPNPVLSGSGIVRGMLPFWELGPTWMVANVLSSQEACSIFVFGPDFQGNFWGDRPQRLSLAATGASVFPMLAECGEKGSVAISLRRREIGRLEAAGIVTRETLLVGQVAADNDSLASLGLLCTVMPDSVVFSYRPATAASKMKIGSISPGRRPLSERLVNLARMNGNETVSTDGILYGKGSLVTPQSFADNVQWAGGPAILMPIVNAAKSHRTLALAIKLVRESSFRHPPNLEMMQKGGGYRMLAVLLQEKRLINETVLDQCLAFAIHGYEPVIGVDDDSEDEAAVSSPLLQLSAACVFTDLDAMKHMLLNHQLWDIRSSGPSLPLRFLTVLSGLVDHEAVHKAFNSRRLHLLGIVRWTLHAMLEAAELYSAGEVASQHAAVDLGSKWYCEPPNISDVAVGEEPGNPLLLACKTLLRRVLTFMLTPGDLEAIADATIYTISADISAGRMGSVEGSKLSPAPVVRIYLLRLLEELIVDGVNEIMATARERKVGDGETSADPSLGPHSGGGQSRNQTYMTIAMLRGRTSDGAIHPKYQQAQAFLSAFAGVLSPVWFASLLEGCQEEASASAALRLMILMLQSSTSFLAAFEESGGFAPLVLSIPKFSTCSGTTTSMLCQLLHASILHIPSFPRLDATQLADVFNAESRTSEVMLHESLRGNRRRSADPSCGIFALLAECLGRNIQLASFDNELGRKAGQTNKAVLELLSNRHVNSASFQEFCRTPDFLEPLAQALCLIHDEKLQQDQTEPAIEENAEFQSISYENEQRLKQLKRRGLLADVPKDLTATERFIGHGDDDAGSNGVAMIELLRLVVTHAVKSGPLAAPLIASLFRSFPIHASPEQVEAFHLVLVEHCKLVVEEVLLEKEPTAVANCVGICSVILDRLMAGFFTSEPVLEAVKMAFSILRVVSSSGLKSSGATASADQNMILADAVHMTRLTCLVALHRSRPIGPLDGGDPDLQLAALKLLAGNMAVTLGGGQSNWNSPATPAPGSKSYNLWRSLSLARCSPHQQLTPCHYPDLTELEALDRAFIAPLLVEVNVLLGSKSEECRGLAYQIVVELLQKRRGILSELLSAEVPREGKPETIDLMNRGGFGALLVAQEAAKASSSTPSGSVSKKGYEAFFEWYNANGNQVDEVFSLIQVEASMALPGLESGAATPEEAIENEQKIMLLRLTSQDSSDRTILGGLERAEVAQRCTERTTENHVHWRRLGFDDLASGAMRWKILLRQLKGSGSIWEGGEPSGEKSLMSRHELLYPMLRSGRGSELAKVEEQVAEKRSKLVTRWKLDLTEGHERQRRRLFPNYEFHSLYNLDEMADHDDSQLLDGSEGATLDNSNRDFFSAGEMEATAEILKDLNLKRASHIFDDTCFYDTYDDQEGIDEDAKTETTASATDVESTRDESEANAQQLGQKKGSEAYQNALSDGAGQDNETDSSYELITGLLQAGDWPEKSYNVRRCTGLEVRRALLLWCHDAIYIIDGFEQIGGEGLDGRITRVENEQSTFNINLRSKDFKTTEEGSEADKQASGGGTKASGKNRTKPNDNQEAREATNDGATYQHRSQRIAFSELHSVFMRRYQLQQIALEFYDVHKSATLVAFANNAEREEVLSKVLNSPLPNSIFNSSGFGASINYKKFMSSWKSKIVSNWVNGKMTNFEFLMHMNSFAGRTYNDLTQYPVFPWVIADYESEELDLDNPASYRDLSKSMGALSEERAQQFRDRYEALAAHCFSEDDPPPFHYGTHYSCAAYVLYYLMRLEPFSRLALSLQGGKFDVADRLFHNVCSSWKSASEENLQDVRELIPEFYYLPDFLANTNNFDFGTTQKGKTVHDVTLPKWARGDPARFVRINRQALESEYVSKNLHHWIDLVFGYKQRGEEAVRALNTFVHVTYEGEVDLDAMTDPIQRASTIAQIQNFGQTPSRLERKPFPQRTVYQVLKDKNIDFGVLSGLNPLTPPLCVVGAPHRAFLRQTQVDTVKLGLAGQVSKAVGDICLQKGQLVGTGCMCSLIIPSKRYVRFGGPNNGVSVHVATASARQREANKVLSIHDGMHRAPVCAAKASLNGRWLVTGCVDSTVRVWRYSDQKLDLKATLCGHEGWQVTSLDICTEFGTIVTGCASGTVNLWDLRTLTFVRQLQHSKDVTPTVSVSLNKHNGNVLTLVGLQLSVFDVNGGLLATRSDWGGSAPTCAVSTDCPEWMDQGVVAVTGHEDGGVFLWGLDYDNRQMYQRHSLDNNPHKTPITCLRVVGDVRQDTLLVGETSGVMSMHKTMPLEFLSQAELSDVVDEIQSHVRLINGKPGKKVATNDSGTWIGGLITGVTE